jgi:very-short-patch-repair endonuclease
MVSNQPYIRYNTGLKKLARDNRKRSTCAENRFWYEVLRNKQLGFKFLRQKPLAGYIVDFYCSELLLVIEIDGESHTNRQAYDARRTDRLNSLGIRVARYTNDEVLQNTEGIHDNLLRILKRRAKEIAEVRK